MFQFQKKRDDGQSNQKWYERFQCKNLPASKLVIHKIRGLRFEQKILCGNAIAVFVFASGLLMGVKIGEYPQLQAKELHYSLQKERVFLSKLRNHALALEELREFPPSSQEYIQTHDLLSERIQATRSLLTQLLEEERLSSLPEIRVWRSQFGNEQSQFLLKLEKILAANPTSERITELKQQLQKISQTEIIAHRQLIYQLSQRIETIEQQEPNAEVALANAQRINLVIVICFIGLSMATAYYISRLWSRKLVHPLIYTTHKAQDAIAQINGRGIDTSSNEVHNLTTAFNLLLEYTRSLEEEQKTAQRQIEQTLTAKTRFLANISHELRTPLNGILGYAQMMMRSPNLNPEYQRGVTTIYNCGSHLLNLINDILDFSRFETDKFELRPTDFHFPSFCQGIIESCRLAAKEKGLQLVYQPAFNLPIGINADKNRLRQVITNLINYAIKSTNSGYVKLKIQAFPHPNHTSKQIINIKIRKSDGGLTEEQIQGLFSPFEHVYNHEPQGDEPGFSIALSEQILRKMGSKLKIKTSKLKGTSFSFTISCPIPDDWTENSTISGKGKIIGYTGEQKKILIVDDSRENRAILIGLLESLKFIVIEANNGEEGFAQVIKFKPDLIISDIGMPIMDGWELLAKVRQLPGLLTTKFILSSASISEYEQELKKKQKVDAFLTKPIKLEELYAILQQQLNLNWNYANPPLEETSLEAEGEIIIPPFTVIASLLEFAKRGQIRGIQDELNKIDLLDQRYANFVKKLRYYTKTFNIHKIRDFLSKNIRK